MSTAWHAVSYTSILLAVAGESLIKLIHDCRVSIDSAIASIVVQQGTLHIACSSNVGAYVIVVM